MGLIASKEQYFEAVKSLYPEGLFFERQFENKDSDIYKLVKVQSEMIYNFKKDLNKLWLESRLETCTEDTIEDYERILSGILRPDLTLEERKTILLIQNKNKLNIDSLNTIINKYYSANIIKIDEKIKPSVFGFSRFGNDRIFNYRAFCIIMIYLTIEDPSKKQELEKFLDTIFMANKIIIYNYILPSIEEITVDYINKIIKNYISGCTVQKIEKDFEQSLFAHSKFGRTRIFNYMHSNSIIIYVTLAGKRKRALFEDIFYTIFSINTDKTIFFVYVIPAEIDLNDLNKNIEKYDAHILKSFNYFESSELGDLKTGQIRILNYINHRTIIFYVQLNNQNQKDNFESYIRSIYPENIVFFEYIN
ncbi:DUF2313 domain-containing protein [Brachyspira pulli]|uniref:DUF2313 domain-containing protein n=1 Tax=Brachyspira pulli TaxID=310721 RepID=UPI003007EEFE